MFELPKGQTEIAKAQQAREVHAPVSPLAETGFSPDARASFLADRPEVVGTGRTLPVAAAPPAPGSVIATVSSQMGTAANMTFAGVAALKGAFDIEVENARLDVTHSMLTAVAGMEGVKADQGAGASVYRMTQTLLQSEAARLNDASRFSGSEQSWNGLADLNIKKGAALGIMGLNYSPYAPGVRSTDATGGAFFGRLDSGQHPDEQLTPDMRRQVSFYAPGEAAVTRIENFRVNELNNAVQDAISNYSPTETNTGIPDPSKW